MFLIKNKRYQNLDTPKILRLVALSMLPAIIIKTYYFGYGAVFHIVFSIFISIVTESIILLILKRPIKNNINDFSAVVTAIILGLSMPSQASYLLPLVASIIAIGLGKMVYGGLGNNIFNPAMVGYVAILIAYPQLFIYWISPNDINPNLIESLKIFFNINTTTYDSITSATPLTIEQDMRMINKELYISSQKLLHNGWWQINLSFILGGLFLIYKKIIDYKIPIFTILSFILINTIFYLIDNTKYVNPISNLMIGNLIFCALFIATDPVGNPQSDKAKIIFAIFIGVMIYIIRTFSNYVDGVAFAILLANTLTPLLDYLLPTKHYGKHNND